MFHPFSDDVAAAMTQPHVDVIVGVEVFAPTGTVRVHTGTGKQVMAGQLFLGVGTLGAIGQIKEDGSTTPKEFTLSLSLLEAGIVALALNEQVVGSKVNLFIGVVRNGAVVASNRLISGEVSASTAKGGDENLWTLTVAGEMAAWDRIPADRYTDESQMARRGGDRFFRYIGQMAERVIAWGSRSDAPAFIYK